MRGGDLLELGLGGGAALGRVLVRVGSEAAAVRHLEDAIEPALVHRDLVEDQAQPGALRLEVPHRGPALSRASASSKISR